MSSFEQTVTPIEVGEVIRCTTPGSVAPELLRRALFGTADDWQTVRDSVRNAIVTRRERMRDRASANALQGPAYAGDGHLGDE